MIFLFLTTFAIYLPIIINPHIFLNRGNDLTEFFWPIYYFVKQQILVNQTLPLWNNLFLSGTPLLPDPQSPLFYLPNVIFLILPLGTAFILAAFIHTLAGGVGFYLLAKHGLRLNKKASLFAGVLYLLSPQLAGFIEAGHFGLIEAMAWLPFAFLATIKLADDPKKKWIILLALPMVGLFFTHTTTFVWAVILTPLVFVTKKLLLGQNKKIFKSLLSFALAAIIAFGLTAIALLPQIEWSGQTTRVLLTSDRQVFPIWLSFKEYFGTIFTPWAKGVSSLREIPTEKWIPLGLLPTLLALIGFFKVKPKIKILVLVSALLVLVWSLNNRSPIDFILINFNWYVFSRVSTRIWFVAVFLVYLLAAHGFQKLSENKFLKVPALTLALLAAAEIAFISILKVTKPVVPQTKFISQEVYEFLKKDTNHFRVFCLNRCIPQKEAAENSLELVEGYSTLPQMNYYREAQKLTGASWNYYTLSIPPIGTYLFEKPQPDPQLLGKYNTKYVISPYQLKSSNFVLKKVVDNYFVYENKLFAPRANAPITFYSPNKITVDVSGQKDQAVVLSEIYSPGWHAYLDGNKETAISETAEGLRSITPTPEIKFVDFIYNPASFVWGRIITFSTIILLAGQYIFVNVKKK